MRDHIFNKINRRSNAPGLLGNDNTASIESVEKFLRGSQDKLMRTSLLESVKFGNLEERLVEKSSA